MEYYTANGVFSLVPKDIYTKNNGEKILRDQFNLNKEAIIKSLEIPDFNAFLVYSDNHISDSNIQVKPLIIALISILKDSKSYNKVIIHYSHEQEIAQLIICTWNKLELITSFKSDSFDTAIYYLLLSLKKLQINHHQTSLRICNKVTKDQMDFLNNFFRKVTLVDLSKDIKIV